MKQSGASNRARQRDATTSRHREERFTTRRLANLSPEEAQQAQQLMDAILAGHLRDPDRLGMQEEGGDEDDAQ